ncbi:pentapeptide repeat-containing protein [Streptomyces clavuligerus]|uniref:pentapeptide repeat-containing protein n=1 Tax=Streptomyces clavuligerus TaxID=1901 RepID=UPI00201122AE|nr:pentapeptide repeat-containing protein [Streptomyces clavuligerus]
MFATAWGLLDAQGLKREPRLDSRTFFDLVKLSFGVVAGAGALVALVVAYRRQRVDEDGALREATRLHTERFTAAVGQLGDPSAAVRLGGVHALAGLADDAPTRALRQTCVDVLCAYLRLPYITEAHLPGDDADARHAYLSLREVRHTVIRLIRDHLRLDADHPHSWQGHDFDFTGVVFDGGDFTRAVFSGGIVDFGRAVFRDARVSFENALFTGGIVDFGRAVFPDGTVSFENALFTGGIVDFRRAVFSGGTVTFARAVFSGGGVDFTRAVLSRGVVDFKGAVFSGGTVDLVRTVLSGGWADFRQAVFKGGIVDFTQAVLSGGVIDFRNAVFSGGTVKLARTVFTGGAIASEGAVGDLPLGLVDQAEPPLPDDPFPA